VRSRALLSYTAISATDYWIVCIVSSPVQSENRAVGEGDRKLKNRGLGWRPAPSLRQTVTCYFSQAHEFRILMFI
jgi:hypothetical protein